MKEEYIQIRQSIFELLKNNEKLKIPLDFFYRYYVQQFDNQPKERIFPRKDLFGNNITDYDGNTIWEKIDTHFMNINEFASSFSNYIAMCFNDILEFLDKKFELVWCCDKQGNKLKLVL